MLPLLASSQMLSTDSNCVVPCKALKNALHVKNERDYLKDQIGVVRDSVRIQTNTIKLTDSLLQNNNIKLQEYKTRDTLHTNIISNKDKEIVVYKSKYENEKTYRRISNGVSIGLLLLFIIL